LSMGLPYRSRRYGEKAITVFDASMYAAGIKTPITWYIAFGEKHFS
jgi:hypothetical protein